MADRSLEGGSVTPSRQRIAEVLSPERTPPRPPPLTSELAAAVSRLAAAADDVAAQAATLEASLPDAVVCRNAGDDYFAQSLADICRKVSAAARALRLQTDSQRYRAGFAAAPVSQAQLFEADVTVLRQRLRQVGEAAAARSPPRQRPLETVPPTPPNTASPAAAAPPM